MNFKTTSILLIVLAALGVYVFLTRDAGTQAITDAPAAKKLLTISGADVQTITIKPADNKATVFTRDGTNWTISQPIKAPAENGEVNALLSALTALESQATTDVTEGTGLKQPRFVVDLATNDGKTTSLNIGDKSGVGDRLYVQVQGNSKADVVATGVEEQLDKPLEEYRQKKLIALNMPDIKYLAIDRPGAKLELVKTGQEWKITAPSAMPADASAVSDLLMGITGLQANEFVEGDAASAVYGLGEGAKLITLSTASPSATQPSSQPAPVTITIGRPDSVLQKNVFATVSGTNAIVKVAKGSLGFLDKTPLDLRDKTVLSVEPKSVTKVSVAIDRPATTQPTTKPAEKSTMAVTRRPPPATQPATTQPSTQPSPQPSAWIAAAPQAGDANDSAVEVILNSFRPLRAEKFIESAPVTGTVYDITLETGGGGIWTVGKTQLQIVDPGDSKPPVATYNGLHFEVERMLLDRLKTDFTKPGKPRATAPEGPTDFDPPMPSMMP